MMTIHTVTKERTVPKESAAPTFFPENQHDPDKMLQQDHAAPAAMQLPLQRQPTIEIGKTKSGRIICQPQRLITVKQSKRSTSSDQKPDENVLDQLHQEDYVKQRLTDDPIAYLSKGIKVLPSVWAMKRKRDIATRAILKYKARLNVHGGKQEYGVNYNKTYLPDVEWWALRLFFIIAIL